MTHSVTKSEDARERGKAKVKAKEATRRPPTMPGDTTEREESQEKGQRRTKEEKGRMGRPMEVGPSEIRRESCVPNG